MEDKDLVWVPKELAEKIKAYNDPFHDKVVNLMEKYIDESKDEWKINLKLLEEDLVMYRGLMVKTKKEFEKAKNEQCSAAYELWGKFEKDLPKTQEKIDKAVKLLNPLEEKLNTIVTSIKQINTFDIERLVKLISKLDSILACSGATNDIMMFLMNNYKNKKEN